MVVVDCTVARLLMLELLMWYQFQFPNTTPFKCGFRFVNLSFQNLTTKDSDPSRMPPHWPEMRRQKESSPRVSGSPDVQADHNN
jgi:hypothetical protein